MTNAEWSDRLGITPDWILTRTGIETRRVAGENETTLSLAVPAARDAIADAGLSPADIDEIIVATDTPEVGFPDTAAFLQHELGVGHVPGYDLAGSGCAGFVLAIDIARSRARDGRTVLVVGVDLITKVMDWTDRNTAVLFGDGAGAVVVGAAPGSAEILAVASGTDGSQTGVLIREAGGTRTPVTAEIVADGSHRAVTMDGQRLFKHAVKRMKQAAAAVLSEAGLAVEDLTLVVPHQANARIISALRKSLGLGSEQMFSNLERYGNTGSASVPIALCQARDQGLLADGGVVLLTAFGSGLHWSAAALRFPAATELHTPASLD